MKRGNVEVLFLLAVAAIAIAGLVFVLYPKPKSSGMWMFPSDYENSPPIDITGCQSACYGRPIGQPAGQPLFGYELRACLSNCQIKSAKYYSTH